MPGLRVWLRGLAAFFVIETCLASPLIAGPFTPPKPDSDPSTWISSSDYPKSEWSRGVTGITEFRLLIDDKGIIADCTVTQSSGSVALDATTCALVKVKGHFTPARDSNGNNVSGFWTSRVRWKLPTVQPQALPQGRWDVTIDVTVDVTGTIESCDFASAGNEIPPNEHGITPCTPYPAGMKMGQFVDDSGKPSRYEFIRRETREFRIK